MESSLSLTTMFYNASFIVKMIMLGLLFSSIVSWAIIFNRNRCISARILLLKKFQATLNSGVEILVLYKQIAMQKDKVGIDSIFFKGVNEFLYLSKSNHFKASFLVKEIKRIMVIALNKENEFLEKNLTTLATIQSISPYIGLFGTIWGIMNVFHQLGSHVGQATLSAVAPGISEALIATAMGLFAAIPAGIFYNKFISKIDHLMSGYQRSIQELISVIGKKIYYRNRQQSAKINANLF